MWFVVLVEGVLIVVVVIIEVVEGLGNWRVRLRGRKGKAYVRNYMGFNTICRREENFPGYGN